MALLYMSVTCVAELVLRLVRRGDAELTDRIARKVAPSKLWLESKVSYHVFFVALAFRTGSERYCYLQFRRS